MDLNPNDGATPVVPTDETAAPTTDTPVDGTAPVIPTEEETPAADAPAE